MTLVHGDLPDCSLDAIGGNRRGKRGLWNGGGRHDDPRHNHPFLGSIVNVLLVGKKGEAENPATYVLDACKPGNKNIGNRNRLGEWTGRHNMSSASVSLPSELGQSRKGSATFHFVISREGMRFGEQAVNRIMAEGKGFKRDPNWPPHVCAGRVFTVREVEARLLQRGGPLALRLVEYVHPTDQGWETPFPANAFRPLDERRLDIFRSMLVTPPKEPVAA